MSIVSIFGKGVEFVEGAIINQDANSVTLRIKKPRSSKFYTRFFNKADLTALQTYEVEGEEYATVGFASDRVEVMVAEGSVAADKAGNTIVTGDDGSITIIPAGVQFEATGEDEEEAAPAAKKGAKKAPAAAAKKGGKKAPVVEDDEEEEEEEEEEEVAPKKGAKKAPAKAAKKGAKKAPAEDEEDDWEDE